jgi:hypothetical protein
MGLPTNDGAKTEVANAGVSRGLGGSDAQQEPSTGESRLRETPVDDRSVAADAALTDRIHAAAYQGYEPLFIPADDSSVAVNGCLRTPAHATAYQNYEPPKNPLKDEIVRQSYNILQLAI